MKKKRKKEDPPPHALPQQNLYLITSLHYSQHKKASDHHANLPLEMYSFTL